ncbi:MAG: GNAT family N-acetyltransferase [Candidatus Pacearchaeota archaeon]
MKIRKAKINDLKQINEIYVEGSIDEGKLQFPHVSEKEMEKDLKKHEWRRLKGWKKELKLKNNYWIVAEEKGKIIGFANADIDKSKEGRLTLLYIRRDYRKRGIGMRLTKERINWLKSKKIKRIESGVYLNNKPSINNLKKSGFKPVALKLELKLKK